MDKNLFLIDLSESERTDFGKVDFAAQSVAQKTFSAIWELESQVNGGGFAEFFRSAETETIMYATEALRRIGANSCAEIVDSAIALVSPIPANEEARIEAIDAALEADEELFEELDNQFFEYPDNLTELLFEYVSQHPDEFGEVPS